MIFTIAIPTFNNEETIKNTITSCISQSFTEDYEILVVNNNSTDNTENILNEFGDTIRTITNNETVSMFENHNICLEKAKGDYIIFCHSDDQLLSDSLTKFYEIIQKRGFPKRYVLWGRSLFRDYFPIWSKGGYRLNEIAAGINALDIFNWGGVTPSGTCYSRKTFADINGFVKVKNKLAPSDYVTLWKLVVNFFEFEMADRLFFVRKNASTASGVNYNKKNIINSIIEAIASLKEETNLESFNSILTKFKSIKKLSPQLALVLIKMGLIEKRHFKKKYILNVIRKPMLLKNKDIRKILF